MAKKTKAEPLKPIESGEPEAGVSRTLILGYGNTGVPRVSSNTGIRMTARQLFTIRKRHAFVAAVHNAIIKQVRKVEIEVVPIDPKKQIDEGTKSRMENFLKTGFGELGEKEFRSRMVDTKKWYGDAFAEIVFDASTKEPIMANYIYAETMRILPDEHGIILGYPQVVDGQLTTTFPVENVMHMKEHYDEYSLFGWPDIESLIGALLLDTLAEEHTASTLENDATPAGVLAFPSNISDIDVARLRAQFISQLRQNPNKPVFLNNTPQWIPMSIGTLKDMDYQELHKQVKEKVMMVYSVLPMQVAVVETGRLANPEQQLEIGEEYIRQELEQVQAAYNLKFTARFERSENLMYRFKELDPKLDAQKKEADIMLTKANAAKTLASIPDTYTINEVRAVSGHEEREDGEQYISGPEPAPAFPLQSIPLQQNRAKPELKPFAGYADFDDCVAQNGGKDNPQAYCATIMQNESASPEKALETKALQIHKLTRAQGQKKMVYDIDLLHERFIKQAVKLAAEQYPKTKDKKLATKGITDFVVALGPITSALKDAMDASVKDNAREIFKGSKEALGFGFNQQDEKALMTILLQKDGAFDAVKSFTKDQREGLGEVMKEAFENGLSVPDMKKALREYSEQEGWKLERIARTESHRIANNGRIAGYQELEERRGEEFLYDWNNVIDDRTSDECIEIVAGNPYPLDEIIKLTDGGCVHPNCRGVIVRAFK